MKDFAIRFYEDHGLWTVEGLGASVPGCTSALTALEAWKHKLLEVVITDAIIKHELDVVSPLDIAKLDIFRSEIDALKLSLASEQLKNAGLINAIKKMKEVTSRETTPEIS